eukprot:gene9078-10020_t
MSEEKVDTTAVLSSFEVSSGALCFGQPHNLRHGASQAVVQPAVAENVGEGGTVVQHALDFNYAALDGTWKVYGIYSDPDRRLCAYLSCHESVADPFHELQHILSISGSPYESNHGISTFPCKQTFESGVLVINRYDWSYYDERGDPSQEEDADVGLQGSTASLCDYQAASQLRDYGLSSKKEVTPLLAAAGDSSAVGVRLVLKGHEYEFGRFGMVGDRSKVKSFLFFSSYTDFDKAVFMEKAVKDGSFGVSFESPPPPVPPNNQLFAFAAASRGDKELEVEIQAEDYFFTSVEDVANLSADRLGNLSFHPDDSADCLDLINGCLAGYLADLSDEIMGGYRFVNFDESQLSNFVQFNYRVDSPSAARKFIGKILLEQEAGGPLAPAVQQRVAVFLNRTLGEEKVPEEILRRIGNVAGWLVNEVLELSNNARLDNGANAIKLRNLLSAVFYDQELLELFKRSAYLWRGF